MAMRPAVNVTASPCRAVLKWRKTVLCALWLLIWLAVTRKMPDAVPHVRPLQSLRHVTHEALRVTESPPEKAVHQKIHSAIALEQAPAQQLKLSPVVVKPNSESDPLQRAGHKRVPLLSWTDKSYHLKLEQLQREVYEAVRDNAAGSLIFSSGEMMGPYERPVRFNVLLASQRTGSSFIGSVLAAHPGTYYHHEPTHFQGLAQAREGKLLTDAEGVMKDLLHCGISEAYINTSREGTIGLHQNAAWTHFCGEENSEPESANWCWSREVLKHLCRTYPVHLVKSNNVRLHGLLPLLKQIPSRSPVKVLLTGRDPRSIRHSRQAADFCKGRPQEECDDPLMCADMVRDYRTAVEYSDSFKGKIRIVRLEDINRNPLRVFGKITDFLGLRFTEAMKALVTESSNGSSHDDQQPLVRSTKRDPQFEELQWRRELSWQDIVKIQDECQEAMELWGYHAVTDAKQLDTFEAVGDFKPNIAI